MRFMSYSPSVTVYVAATGGNGVSYYDLSNDIVQCSVNRQIDGASTFTIRLVNENWKYNDLFNPMDRVSISCVKVESYQLFAGYITTVPKFSTYQSDITISGSCPIYRLQQLYWDPGLVTSKNLLGFNYQEHSWDAVLVNLLTKVAGYTEDKIFIGEMPQEAIDFATEMYVQGKQSSDEMKSMVNEFYQVLQTHGPKFSSSSSASVGGTSGDQPISGEGGGAFLTGVDFNMPEAQFVKLWGDRINAWYHRKWSGSPLEGHGETYARAAYKAKFEPRFLPAVSGAEQSGGLVESNLNGNYYGWGVYDSGIGAPAHSADGIDAWIYYLLSDKAIFAGKPLYKCSWDEIARSWASSQAWADRVMGFMQEI